MLKPWKPIRTIISIGPTIKMKARKMPQTSDPKQTLKHDNQRCRETQNHQHSWKIPKTAKASTRRMKAMNNLKKFRTFKSIETSKRKKISVNTYHSSTTSKRTEASTSLKLSKELTSKYRKQHHHYHHHQNGQWY